MAKGYQVGIGSETSTFEKGIKSGIIEPLEDAQKELLDLGKNRGPEQLERSMEDAQKESKDLKKEIERTADAIEKDFKRSYREMKQSSEDGFSKSQEASSEFKSEAIQNFSEVASSFDGDMSSIADLAQGTFGGLANGLAGINLPAAIAAGAIGAVGGALLSNLAEAAEESEARVTTAFEAMVANGRAALDETTIQSNMSELVQDIEKNNRLKADAIQLGVDYGTVLRAAAGDQEALNEVQSRGAQRQQDLSDALGAYASEHQGALDGAISKELALVQAAQGRFDTYSGEMSKAAGMFADFDQGVAASKSGLEGFNAEVGRTGGQKTLTVTADTSAADAALRTFSNSRYVANMTLKLNDQYGRNIV